VFGCARQVATELRAAPTRIESAKSSAILGGQPSALDLISAQQTSEAALSQSFAAEQVMAPTSAMPCPLGAVAKLAEFVPLVNKIPVSDDFLGSERVAIGRTPLDRAWRRVSRKTGSVWAVTSLVRQRSETDADHLGKVNTWVNRNIEFVEDKALYGRSDYWATAGETLRRMQGDCEDFAILKYQFLVDSGFDPDSIYLTLVWDPVRRRDHAVLIVKLDDGHYLLDNETDQILPADGSNEYTAKMSFSQRSAWLHGYTTRSTDHLALAPRQVAYFSDKAVSNALATGFSR
jgi:predicted transglutaminase-like cysteine proteinase